MKRRSEIQKETPNAEFIQGMMLIGIKGAELPAELQEWKGRFVALGNIVRDL